MMVLPILETAAQLVVQKGVENVTMAVLAKTLGIRSPSLYNHVNGIGDLRKKLAIHGLNQLYERMASATVGRSRDDAVRSLANALMVM